MVLVELPVEPVVEVLRPLSSSRSSERSRIRKLFWTFFTPETSSAQSSARRRQQDHRGRGPQNYTRSDDRIREDVSDNLTEDWGVDASNVTVTVSNGDVTLDGTVATRLQKRRAEDCAEEVSGVKNVQNNLRIRDRSLDRDDDSGLGTSTTASAGSSTKTSV